MMEIENKRGKVAGYFNATQDGEQIGEVNYRISEDSERHILITHVGIDHEHRGAGKAGELMEKVIDYARAEGLKITPLCSYAKATFRRYPEMRDVLAEGVVLE